MIKAVVFDLDNTLYDYDTCNVYALTKLEEYCKKYFELSSIDFHRLFSESKKITKDQIGNVGASHNRILYMQKFLELLGIPPVSRALEMYDIYWDAMLEKMKLFEYVLPLCEKLHGLGIRIGILTNLTAHIQYRKLRQLGLSFYVDVIVTSEEAGKEKPDSVPFLLLRDKMGVLPSEMLMIGDSYIADYKAALDTGMHAILFKKEDSYVFVEKCMRGIKEINGNY